MAEKDIYFVVGKNIKKYRKVMGFTQEELARRCNLSYGFIKNLEAPSVHATISLETLVVIAKKLNIPLINLLH